MLYFRISSCFLEEDLKSDDFKLEHSSKDYSKLISLSTTVLIKVGYCDEKTYSERLYIYKTENPSIIEYKILPGGTKEDESRFIERFREKRAAGREWFKLDEEILEFLSRINTIDDLRWELRLYSLKKPAAGSKKIKAFWISGIFEQLNYYKKEELYVKCILFIEECLQKFGEDLRDVNDYTIKKVSEYFCIDYEDYKNYIFNALNNVNPTIIRAVDDLNCNQDKIKIFCDYITKNRENDRWIESFLLLLPIKYSLYNILGLDRCKAHGYNITRIGDEITNLLIPTEIIKDKFLCTFKSGDKYSKVWIKNKIREIYEELGLNKNSKASDLGKYFDIKPIKLKDQNGNWIHGFEILGEK